MMLLLHAVMAVYCFCCMRFLPAVAAVIGLQLLLQIGGCHYLPVHATTAARRGGCMLQTQRVVAANVVAGQQVSFATAA